ncbi:MAG: hypothetical protein CSA72_02940 [Rhodobacterales bacterium]|nr:MAG: hypothetical protein CSA72_02940 [Rhodobacterales bacterium]
MTLKTPLFALTMAALGLTGGAAFAQEETTNRVASETDWSVFVESDPKECFAVSKPKQTLNTRNGQPVEVRRGKILLFVFYRPGANVSGQVTFTGGYPFAPGSTVSMQIGDSSYDLFTEGEWAWPATPGDDAKIVASMKRGANAVLTARSARGTQTQDTFSLLGFTASVDEAGNRCK